MLWLLLLIIIIGVIGYLRLPLKFATLMIAAWLIISAFSGTLSSWMWFIWASALAILAFINIPVLRQNLISKPAMKLLKANLPKISKTEQEALDGGNVWWDAELFSGKPNWSRLRDISLTTFTPEEQAFINGPVEELCGMLDDWKITHEMLDLPPEVWSFIKDNKFLGMIIPQKYGGLGFSAHAHSEVVMKVSGRSITAGVTIMVPNSLGPGELLMKYGTKEQQDHYLPRLAVG